MTPPSFVSSSSRRSFLTATGTVALASVGAGRVAASTDEWVRLWELPAESPQQSPTAFDETVFVPTAAVVRAVDAETGDATWVNTVDETIAAAGLLTDGDRLYAGTEDGTLHCLRADDGEPLWSRSLGAAVEGLAAVDSGVVVGTAEALVSVDEEEGAERWRTPVEGSGTDRSVTPATDGTTAVGSRGGTIVAVSVESGEVQWTAGRPTDDGVNALAVWEDSVVVAGDATTDMLTLASGDRLWSRPSGAEALVTVPDSSMYAMGPEGTVAIDPASGRTEQSLDIVSAPGGGLAVGEIEPHGVSVLLSGAVDGTPTMLAVAPETGEDHWRRAGEGDGFGRPVLADERLVVQDYENGVTVAYGEPPDEVVSTATATARPADTGSGGGIDFDNIVAVLSILVTIGAGLVGLAQLLHDRKQ